MEISFHTSDGIGVPSSSAKMSIHQFSACNISVTGDGNITTKENDQVIFNVLISNSVIL